MTPRTGDEREGDDVIRNLAEQLAAIAKRDPGRLLSRKHAAEYLDTSIDTVKRLIASGELRAVRITPAQVHVRADDLHALIERRTQQG